MRLIIGHQSLTQVGLAGIRHTFWKELVEGRRLQERARVLGLPFRGMVQVIGGKVVQVGNPCEMGGGSSVPRFVLPADLRQLYIINGSSPESRSRAVRS